MDIKEFKYENGPYSFTILNLGCAVTSICCPDRNGNIANVTLPYPDGETVFKQGGFFGLTVGRFANRIGGASFEFEGKKWTFEPNEKGNYLHSGNKSMEFKIWDVKRTDDGFLCYLKMTEEEDGFPGDLETYVRFSMTSTGVFSIHYKCICTKDCPLNITNHTYFNLTGDPKKSILNHELRLNSSRHLEIDDELIPTGKYLDNKNTIYDFTTAKPIGRDIDTMGYDHCFMIDRDFGQTRGFIQFAHVYDPESGRIMTCYTDLPAVQFYSGNMINGSCGYENRHGFCLETQFCPDYVNKPQFTSGVVKAGEVYESTTTYNFSTDVKEDLSCLK